MPDQPRIIGHGQSFTIGDDIGGLIERDEVPPHPDPPPPHTRGEPWGWTKPGGKPRGWREDGRYGPD
jgi:hypothetical protein